MSYLSLVQGQLEAYNNFHLDAFCSFYHSEITVKSGVQDIILIQGMRDFKISYDKVFKSFPNQECILKSRIILEKCIIDEELILGRPEHTDGLHAVAIYTFSDNLIKHVCFY